MALKGIKVVEMMGLAPGPFCGTILADFGASVTVVQKIDGSPFDVMSSGKKMISVNLKSRDGVEIIRKLCNTSDVLLDTYRPGVMEKLGLGPKLLTSENPRLIYARLSGYGQDGYYKDKAGHDINYVAMSGLLSMFSKNKEPPQPPLNYAADFAGGSVLCSLGILLALYERTKSGKGQIIDCSMTEGVAYISTWLLKSRNLPIWSGEPGTNTLDGGLPSYRTYKTKDGKFMAVGALEPQFYSNFLKGLELCEDDYSQYDNTCKERFQEIFFTKTQEEWTKIFENIDACVTPVLEINNLLEHPCHTSRKSFSKDEDALVVPKTAPKLSRTPGHTTSTKTVPKPGQDTIEILQNVGYSHIQINNLIKSGHVYAKETSKL